MTADLEKTTPTTVPRSRGRALLCCWAAVSTTLLLCVLIASAVYLNHIKSQCDISDDDSSTQHYTMNDEDGKEDLYRNGKDMTDIYIKKNKEGAIVLISDIDYKTKITATYLAKPDQCYLTAGEEMNWQDVDSDAEKNQEEIDDRDDISDEDADSEDWEADYSNKVTDMTILPKFIRPFCQGKDIYWMVPSELKGMDEQRSKRSTFMMCQTVDVYCPYTEKWQRGKKCYHYIFNTGWKMHYISKRCVGHIFDMKKVN